MGISLLIHEDKCICSHPAHCQQITHMISSPYFRSRTEPSLSCLKSISIRPVVAQDKRGMGQWHGFKMEKEYKHSFVQNYIHATNSKLLTWNKNTWILVAIKCDLMRTWVLNYLKWSGHFRKNDPTVNISFCVNDYNIICCLNHKLVETKMSYRSQQ